MPRTYQGDLSEVSVFGQEEHQGFCFGVSKSNVVLEDFWTVLGYHETGEQDTNEWETYLTSGQGARYASGCVLTFSPHTVYSRL